MRRCPPFVVAAVVLVVATQSSTAAADAAPSSAPTYRPPVDAPLTDTFRPPATRYGAGNRGVDYATAEDQPVHAAADGEVVFAGRIGAASHVTVLHADGIRTSYSFLATTRVRRGDDVIQGQPLGTAGPAGLHFGARAGDAYVDPLTLLGQADDGAPNERRAWLVDDPDPSTPLTEQQERNLVVEALASLANRATGAVDWLADQSAESIRRKVELLQILADDAVDLGLPMSVHLAVAAARWQAEQSLCTPATTPVPTTHADQRRIAILVGGLGSATGDAAILDVDTSTLGYDDADVHQFTYRVDGEPYGSHDTQGDIGEQGRRLAAQIQRLQQQHPDTPVDVIAHSQGGLVARSAITTHRAAPTTLVTLGTPHQGTDIATAAAGLDATTVGHLLLEGATLASQPTTGLDLDSTSIQQMAETSAFITALPERGWDPTRTHVVSIAARADPVVPNHQSRLGGDAYNTVVTPYGTSSAKDHSALPGSPEATREIQRALNRQPPTCRTLQEATTDTLVGRHTSNAHDAIGAALATAGLYADVRTGQVVGPAVPALSNR